MDINTKLQNFWFYYKKHLLVALAVMSVLLYLGIQKAAAPKADYHIGLVRAVQLTDAELQSLEAVLRTAGEDRNGDGQVLVALHTYYVDLADDAPNAGVANAGVVAGLDADLVGAISGIFLLEDVDLFRSITGNILAEGAVPMESGLFLTIRADADPAYVSLYKKLS